MPSPSDGSSRGLGRVTIVARSVVEKIHKSARGKKVGGNSKGTIVWGVGLLPDHTIVTSDSLGNVVFWDGTSMAQKQSFQAHKADGNVSDNRTGELLEGKSEIFAADFCLPQYGRTVYTAGPDQRISQFTAVTSSSGDVWRHTANRRIHAHDIRSLAMFPPYTPYAAPSKSISLSCSGKWGMGHVISFDAGRFGGLFHWINNREIRWGKSRACLELCLRRVSRGK